MIDFTKPLRVKGCSALGVRVRVEFEEGQYDD